MKVPLVSLQVKPAPVAAMVIVLWPLVIAIPVPALNVAAAGAPALDPIMTCPSVPRAVMTGIPEVPVVSTPVLAVASPPTTLADEEYKIWFIVVDEGYVAVEKLGAAAAFDCNMFPVVPGPAKIEGTPVLLVTNKPSLAVAKADITLEADAYKRVLTAFVLG